MNTPFFKALFFPYTLNPYIRQNKNNSMMRSVQKLFKNRLLQSPDLSVRCSEFRVQGSNVRLPVVPER
jgi:hypothetical protein